VEGTAQRSEGTTIMSSKAKKSATQERLDKEEAERATKMAAQKAARLAAKKPALPNRRPLSAIEADIASTQTDDTGNLIKRGEYLIEAKEQIEHGEWTRWLDHNFDLSERTAQSQMQVARYVAGLGKTATIAVLNLSKSAIYTISADNYRAVDCIPAILEEAGKRFLTLRGVQRVIYKYRAEHKTPEEREAERLAAEERQELIAKADLQWVPDADDFSGDHLKVETPGYIYKIVGRGEDDGDNKVFELQRWWKDDGKYVPLTHVVPLDVAKAVCAKDVIKAVEEAAEEAARKAAREAEWEAAQETEASEPAGEAADEAETPAPEPVEDEGASGEANEPEITNEAKPEPNWGLAEPTIIETPFGTVLEIAKPRDFIKKVGAVEAEAFARAILAELGADAPAASSTRSEAPKGKALKRGDPLIWDDWAPTKEDDGKRRGMAEPIPDKLTYLIEPLFDRSDINVIGQKVIRRRWRNGNITSEITLAKGDISYEDCQSAAQADWSK
jgi:hypothetical protein